MDNKTFSGRVIALPVETKVRELDGKTWLGYNLVRQGATVAIGDLSSIKHNIGRIQPDIYIGDSAVYRESRAHLYKTLTKNGTKVVVLDTEGGIYYSPEMYLKRLSPEILQYVDLLLSWGQATDRLFRDYRQNGHTQSRITGNPCFDLLMPNLRTFFQQQTEYLRQKYQNFILINTKFGRFNHFDSKLDHKKLLYDNPEIGQFQEELFGYFIEMIQEISAQHQDLNVVVRPHPSENHAVYKKRFKELTNVHVAHWWSVHPWALAAQAVIHNGCTTGIEGSLLGRPVISYRPIQNPTVDVYIPNAVSDEVFSKDELMDAIESLTRSPEQSDRALQDAQIGLLEDNFHKLDGLASTRVCGALFDLSAKSERNRVATKPDHDNKQGGYMISKRVVAALTRALHLFRAGNHKTQKNYRNQKFSDLTVTEIKSILDKLADIENYQENILISPISGVQNAFWLSGTKQ